MKVLTKYICVVFIVCLLFACNKLIEAPIDPAKIQRDQLFNNNISANSAVVGIYLEMTSPEKFSSGSERSVSLLGALSSDELVTYSTDANYADFSGNSLVDDNIYAEGLWSGLYK